MGFLQTMGTGYKIMGQEAKQKVVDNRANIFTGVSVVGTIATAIVSAFGGAKSARQIDAKAAELGRELTLKEKAKLCWKNFIAPAGTVIGASAGAITSRVIDSGDIARLTTDVAVVSKAYSEFKKASSEVLTEKQQQEVKDKIAEEKISKLEPEKINRLPDPGGPGITQLFMDNFSGIKFFSTVDKVRLAESKLKEMMADLKPRVRLGFSPAIHGVRYYEWLSFIGADEDSSNMFTKEISIFKDYGWNKGYHDDDFDDDDVISFYLAPGETVYQGQERSCYVVYWDTDPSDMKLGDILKSGQV